MTFHIIIQREGCNDCSESNNQGLRLEKYPSLTKRRFTSGIKRSPVSASLTDFTIEFTNVVCWKEGSQRIFL